MWWLGGCGGSVDVVALQMWWLSGWGGSVDVVASPVGYRVAFGWMAQLVDVVVQFGCRMALLVWKKRVRISSMQSQIRIR
jgi:hypothetical protein